MRSCAVIFCALVCLVTYLDAAGNCVRDGNGICLPKCPEGTTQFASPCGGVTLSQKTCRHPEARSLGLLCDYIRCDCEGEKIWDEAAQKCVLQADCSDQTNVPKGNSEHDVFFKTDDAPKV